MNSTLRSTTPRRASSWLLVPRNPRHPSHKCHRPAPPRLLAVAPTTSTESPGPSPSPATHPGPGPAALVPRRPSFYQSSCIPLPPFPHAVPRSAPLPCPQTHPQHSWTDGPVFLRALLSFGLASIRRKSARHFLLSSPPRPPPPKTPPRQLRLRQPFEAPPAPLPARLRPDRAFVMARTPSAPMPPIPPEHPDEFDIFADVSHHGASLFADFLAPQLESFAPPSSSPIPHPALHPRAASDSTAPLSDYHPQSISTSSVAASHPAVGPFPVHIPNAAADSYCSTDQPPFPFKKNPTPRIPAARQPKAPLPGGKVRRPAKGAPKNGAKPTIASSPKPGGTTTPVSRRAPFPPNKIIAKGAKPTKSISPVTGKASIAKRKRTGSGAANRTTDGSRSGSAMGNDSDGSERTDEAKQQSPRSQSLGIVGGEASSLLEDGQSKDTHNSHTRRCRAKVNSKFQELLSVLPTPPPKTGIKHKAQILDYAIRIYRDIHARKTLLEAELALSSRSQLNSWVENIVTRSVSLQDALAPYLSLICTKGGWKYSEAWVPSQEPMRSPQKLGKVEGVSGESRVLTPATLASGPMVRLRLGLAVIPSLGNTDDPELQTKLERFRDRSRSYHCKARVDLPGRVMCTMRPEWLPSLEDQEAFQRARLARNATLVVCFGVPVFVRGHIAAVAVFFDTEQRPYDAKCVDLGDNIAGLLGNAFGASAKFRKKPM